MSNQKDDFWLQYSNFCVRSKVYPLRSVLRHLKGTELCCPVESIRPEHWLYVFTALCNDDSLTKVHFASTVFPHEHLRVRNSRDKGFPVPYGRSEQNMKCMCMTLERLMHSSTHLSVLKLENLFVKLPDAEKLASGLAVSTLTKLSLSGCQFESGGVPVICNSLRNSKLQWLDLSACGLNSSDIEAVSLLIKAHSVNRGSQLHALSLRNRIPNLNVMDGLKRVSLNMNQLEHKSVLLLIEKLTDDLWIKALDLQNCEIKNEGVEAFIKLVCQNCELEIIDLRLNNIDEHLLHRLNEQLALNSAGKTSFYTLTPMWGPSEIVRKYYTVRKPKVPKKSTVYKLKILKRPCRSIDHSSAKSLPMTRNDSDHLLDAAVQTTEENPKISKSMEDVYTELVGKYQHEVKLRKYLVSKFNALRKENDQLKNLLRNQNDEIYIDQETYIEIKHTFEKLKIFFDVMKKYGLWEYISALGFNDTDVIMTENDSGKQMFFTRKDAGCHENQGACYHDNEGACYHDNQGACYHDNQGACYHDNQGACYHDNQGACYHDNQGAYCHDNQGAYCHDSQCACCHERLEPDDDEELYYKCQKMDPKHRHVKFCSQSEKPPNCVPTPDINAAVNDKFSERFKEFFLKKRGPYRLLEEIVNDYNRATNSQYYPNPVSENHASTSNGPQDNMRATSSTQPCSLPPRPSPEPHLLIKKFSYDKMPKKLKDLISPADFYKIVKKELERCETEAKKTLSTTLYENSPQPTSSKSTQIPSEKYVPVKNSSTNTNSTSNKESTIVSNQQSTPKSSAAVSSSDEDYDNLPISELIARNKSIKQNKFYKPFPTKKEPAKSSVSSLSSAKIPKKSSHSRDREIHKSNQRQSAAADHLNEHVILKSKLKVSSDSSQTYSKKTQPRSNVSSEVNSSDSVVTENDKLSASSTASSTSSKKSLTKGSSNHSDSEPQKSYIESVSDASTFRDVKSISMSEIASEVLEKDDLNNKNTSSADPVKSISSQSNVKGDSVVTIAKAGESKDKSHSSPKSTKDASGGSQSSTIKDVPAIQSGKSNKSVSCKLPAQSQKTDKSVKGNSLSQGKTKNGKNSKNRPKSNSKSSSVPSLSDITTVSSQSLNTDSVMKQISGSEEN